MPSGRDWWRDAVFYQVYARSFQDSNGDGIGDLEGVTSRLDYLQWLGVDAIWLSPTFPSPMKDFGYDVSHYCDVHPEFGDLAAMDRLVAAAHAREIRVLLDWVPNHSSNEHPWFQASRRSRADAKRDWYVWRDPKPDGSPPNNWRSVFGGPAWTLDPPTGQYYLHSFLREQPDVNWRNPGVREAMFETLRFWLRRAIDGFRIDVLGRLIKHPELPDNPPDPDWREGDEDGRRLLQVHNRNYPEVFPVVREIRRVLDEFPGAMAVGEVFGTAEEIGGYYGGPALDGIQLAFNFQLVEEDQVHYTPWAADAVRRIIAASEQDLPPGAQPCWALGNHDVRRFLSRHDADGHAAERARAAAVLLLTLRGTPFLYYGEEIGMRDVPVPPEQQQDPARFYAEGRDPERTPMQWDAMPGRGFTTGEPWLPFGDAAISVEAQRGEPRSMIELYRRLLALRRAEPSLRVGVLRLLDVGPDILAYIREVPGEAPLVVAVNTALRPAEVELPAAGLIVVSSVPGAERPAGSRVTLAPLEAVIVRPG